MYIHVLSYVLFRRYSEMKIKNVSAAFRAACPYTIPIMAAYLVLSVAYGVLMQSKGYSPIWALLISMLAYGGSMQYAAVNLFTVPFDPLNAFILSLTVNARYLFCSTGMLKRFSDVGKCRPFLFFSLSDESFAIAATTEPPDGIKPGPFYTAVFLLNYLYWAAGTLLGGLLGSLLPFDAGGLEFTLTAMYTAMLIDLLHDRKSRFCGLVGVGCTAAAVLLFGSQNPVIPAMIMILVILIPARRLSL